MLITPIAKYISQKKRITTTGEKMTLKTKKTPKIAKHTSPIVKKIFVNLSVKDLDKTKEFFSRLGFTFNPQFTDKKAACMIIGENMYAMLIMEEFFKTFCAHKTITDTKKNVEVLNALSLDSRPAIDRIIQQVIGAGGKEFRHAQDHGWMYARAFEDLDGHIWEVFYIDEKKMPKN